MKDAYDDKLRKQYALRRSITDYGMGVFWILLGLAFLLRKKFNVIIAGREPDWTDILAGGLFVAYGIWRLYRGYKKNYFREN